MSAALQTFHARPRAENNNPAWQPGGTALHFNQASGREATESHARRPNAGRGGRLCGLPAPSPRVQGVPPSPTLPQVFKAPMPGSPLTGKEDLDPAQKPFVSAPRQTEPHKTYKIAWVSKGTTHNEQRGVPGALWDMQETCLAVLFITFDT